jgi:putative membrane protein
MGELPMTRPLLLSGGAILLLAWFTPGLGYGAGFLAHMITHMAVVAMAAPLLALAVAGTAHDPSIRHPLLFAALPASLIELVIVWGWHAPAAHELAHHSAPWFALEQASFLCAGLLVWLAALGGRGAERGPRAAQGVLALLLTSMHMTLLGALLIFGTRPLYGGHGPGTFGLDPLVDQQMGGVWMLLVGGVSYLAGGLYLVVRLLNGDPATPAPAWQAHARRVGATRGPGVGER